MGPVLFFFSQRSPTKLYAMQLAFLILAVADLFIVVFLAHQNGSDGIESLSPFALFVINLAQ